jgi:hypothetical protein
MNWYKLYKSASLKQASITFDLEDSWKIAQPRDLLGLSRDFLNFIHYEAKLANDQFQPNFMNIEPDGQSQYDGYTGTINFYIKQDDNPAEYVKAMEAWKQHMAPEGYKIEYNPQPEQSGSRNSQVFRINIAENPSEAYPQMPSLNMANGNALAIIRLLGLPEDYSGSIDLQTLRQRIVAVSQEDMQKEIAPSGWLGQDASYDPSSGQATQDPADGWKGQPPLQDKPPEGAGAKMFIGGRDEEYIDFRLQGLYELVDFGLKNGFKRVTWS